MTERLTQPEAAQDHRVARKAPNSRSSAGGSRREALIDAAARRLNREGVRDTTLRDLAAEMDLTRAALYYYIEDREDLVFQVYRRSCDLLARALGEAVAEGGSALETVSRFVARALAPGEPEMARLTEIGLLRDNHCATVLALHEGVVARLAAILEAGVRAGELRPFDPDIVARTVVSMIHGAPAILNYPFHPVPLDPGDYLATLQDVLMQGWAGDRNRPLAPAHVDLAPYRARQVSAFDREALAVARREQIMITASRLFNHKGIDATSLDEIAAELRVTKRTLYQHVGDKRALVTACIRRSYGITDAIEAEAITRRNGRNTIAEAVFASLTGAAQVWLWEDIAPLRVNLGFDALAPEDRQDLTRYAQALGENWHGYFTALKAAGDARSMDLDILLPMLPTAAAWLARGAPGTDEAQRARIAAQVVDVHRLGLKALQSTS